LDCNVGDIDTAELVDLEGGEGTGAEWGADGDAAEGEARKVGVGQLEAELVNTNYQYITDSTQNNSVCSSSTELHLENTCPAYSELTQIADIMYRKQSKCSSQIHNACWKVQEYM
jgi:hypothetical protein